MEHNQSPDWRWQRARMLAGAGLAPRRSKDDLFVQRAWAYIKKRKRHDLRTELRLAERYPVIHRVCMIFEDTYSHMRWILEAGILADVPVMELSDYLNTDKPTVSLYEKLFFDVRDALAHPGCIYSNVIWPAIERASDDDPDGFWKLIAYHGGWAHVQGCWEMGEATPEAGAFYRRAFKKRQMLKALGAACTARPNSFNAIEYIREGLQQIRIEEERTAGFGGDRTQAALAGLLSSVQLTVARARGDVPAEEPRFALPDVRAVHETVKKKGREGGGNAADG